MNIRFVLLEVAFILEVRPDLARVLREKVCKNSLRVQSSRQQSRHYSKLSGSSLMPCLSCLFLNMLLRSRDEDHHLQQASVIVARHDSRISSASGLRYCGLRRWRLCRRCLRRRLGSLARRTTGRVGRGLVVSLSIGCHVLVVFLP